MSFDFVTTLPESLAKSQSEIEEYARDAGLTFPDVRFMMLDFRQMNQVAAYDGFPQRYPHWRFGMEYERLRKSYAWGLHRIYEMVINTDPCYAYLLKSNLEVDQHLVMAHVYGHADFFQNNLWFAHTNRQMLDEMANHGTRMRRYIDQFGIETVEAFLDRCLSLENLFDIHSPTLRRPPTRLEEDSHKNEENDGRLPSKVYMDPYINPPEALKAANQQDRQNSETNLGERMFPQRPQKDILHFLIEHAPLKPWQQDVLDIVREEAIYFVPQRQTKIMNEGWAVYFHSHIMTRHMLGDKDLIDYADHHSGTLATSPHRINPYKLGVELFKDIEDRWNRGAFGPEYDACTDQKERENWDLQLGLGKEKIFEVRKIYNDIGFIDTFLTPEFAAKQKLFSFRYNTYYDQYEIASREFEAIKQQILFSLTNFGEPYIVIEDANYKNRGELFLQHRWEGIDLRYGYAQDTLENLHALWQRPVHLATVDSEKDSEIILVYDGEEHLLIR
ncbi:MAG: SpoVR family protein [Chloroflexota bacterium]